MPRLCVEYTANLKNYIHLEPLLEELTELIAKVPSINPSLLKSRLWCPEIAYSGTKELLLTQERAYIFVLFEWLEGREPAIQEKLRMALETPLKSVKADLEGKIVCSITYEIREITRTLHETL